MNIKLKMIMPVIVVAILVGGISFFAGIKYQQTKTPSLGNRMGQFQRGVGGQQGMGNNQRGMGGAIIGEIINVDDKSITLRLEDSSSKIVLFSDNVAVSKTDSGSKSDLKTGVKVGVFGVTNPDGTVNAQNIQLNPMFRIGQTRIVPSSSPK